MSLNDMSNKKNLNFEERLRSETERLRQEILRLQIDVEERDNRIEMMRALKKNDESQQDIGMEIVSVSEEGQRNSVDTRGRLKEFKIKIKRLNNELDDKVRRINELEDLIKGQVHERECNIY